MKAGIRSLVTRISYNIPKGIKNKENATPRGIAE